MKAEEIKNLYPVVMINPKTKRGKIIYEKKVIPFKLDEPDSSDFCPYTEIKLLNENGWRRVQDTTAEDDWRFEE